MKFDLDEEQTDIRDMVRRFTEQEITPHAQAWDEHNCFQLPVLACVFRPIRGIILKDLLFQALVFANTISVINFTLGIDIFVN